MKQAKALFFSIAVGLFLLSPSSLSAINYYFKGDTLYAWGVGGLNIREKGSLSANKIGSIPYGSKVVVLESKFYRGDEQKLTVIKARPSKESPDLKDVVFSGKWVLVEFQGVKGYVFDAYLSYFIAPERGKYDALEVMNKYALRTFGLVSERKIEGNFYYDGTPSLNDRFFNYGVSCRSFGNKAATFVWVLPSLSYEELILIYKNGVRREPILENGLLKEKGYIDLWPKGSACDIGLERVEVSPSQEVLILTIYCSC